ncbi:sugar phosphate isomerase/epimerase family protein [Bremerella sp. T1]|uniref:sugar phosphate isomerase/epimerase family protein n=1 Tax=Bremerella sp. TYQ1 TaxID=3119568 RepID=UPI001CCEB266|nr:sugar phosphate isomerase/epimerase family protein [Bremerella volcania]UBM38286.1 sugar phosphate isomerase/epimerase [Bremerella volcania]
MILGYNTNGLAHHDPFDAVEILSEIGYSAIALTIDHLTLTPFGNTYLATRQVDLLAKATEDAKMRTVVETGARFLLDPRHKHEPTFITPEAKGRDLRYEFMRHCIDTAQTLKSDCVSVWSGRLLDDVSFDVAMNRLVASLEPVLQYAADRDVVIGFEPEPGMLIDTMDKFDQLRERIDAPNFKLTLDIGHLHCQRETPLGDYIRRYGDQIVNIHLEDMKAGVHEHLPFGEGEIDFPPIFKALKEIDYQGPINVELSRHSHDGPNMAKQAFEFLKPLL